MGDAEQMWFTVVPALEDGEDEAAELVVIAVDPASGDPGQRVMGTLLDRGHEGEEGVFYLLPFDPATEHGDQPVVLLVHDGPATEQNLFSAFDNDEAALAIIGPWTDEDGP